ncbi:MAG: sodium:proton antiporter, partial [Hyphomicrobiales bacterium]
AGIPVYLGEILSETREYKIDLHAFSHLLATTDNDAYNALVCTEMSHEFSRSNVFQFAAEADEKHANQTMSFTVGGRRLFLESMSIETAKHNIFKGHTMQTTLLSDTFGMDDYLAARSEENKIVCVIDQNNKLEFASPKGIPSAQAGDRIIAFGKPQKTSQES